eukprot:1196352-Prorocentrum_minimum.AAC.7
MLLSVVLSAGVLSADVAVLIEAGEFLKKNTFLSSRCSIIFPPGKELQREFLARTRAALCSHGRLDASQMCVIACVIIILLSSVNISGAIYERETRETIAGRWLL